LLTVLEGFNIVFRGILLGAMGYVGSVSTMGSMGSMG